MTSFNNICLAGAQYDGELHHGCLQPNGTAAAGCESDAKQIHRRTSWICICAFSGIVQRII